MAKPKAVTLFVLLLVSAGAIVAWRAVTQPNAEQLWRIAAENARAARWEDAQTAAAQAVSSRPPTAAEWTRLGRYSFEAGDVQAAETAWQHALELDPNDPAALIALGELWRLSGRYFELGPIVQKLLDLHACPSALLFTTTWPDKVWLDDEDHLRINRTLKQHPQTKWIALGKATAEALNEAAAKQSIELIESATQHDQGQEEALARWGALLLEAGRWEQLTEWRQRVARGPVTHPQNWYLFGLWHLRHHDEALAIRCFWEALERAPFHAGATYQLSQLLLHTRDQHFASEYARQSQLLTELRQAVVYGKGAGGFPDASVLRKIVVTLVELSRNTEAIGWCELAAARHPELRWPSVEIEQCLTRLSTSTNAVWPCTGEPLSRRMRLDHYPLPDWTSAAPTNTPTLPPDSGPSIHFENVAEQRGLQFRYTNGSQITKPHGLMYEISAGGIGVLDYDVDGWPDVYLSEGGPLLHLTRDPSKSDRLLRNRFGFIQDVTPQALGHEMEYGQGVAVGDVNSDGFPDVFVANIGPNQLWLNQGDGTFIDSTATAGLTGAEWTMSAAIADLNGDGLADIYEVNYLGGEALSRTCLRDSIAVQCRPSMFPAVPDRLWLNQGDGRFTDITSDSGILVRPGKGMGVVAADLTNEGKLSLFVTNDMEFNALFRNTAARGQRPQFIEEALVHGVAVGEKGNPLASMGIAAEDIDQNGMMDFYVTNFQSEASNLYLGDNQGGFTDRSRTYGIYEQSVTVMGWGAQCLDAELDGWPDLIVANGHLEDYKRWQILSAMPTQFFRNINGKALSLVSARTLGGYFQERHFGRSVARFDGNRDGREDILITHVDAPVAWLENQTAVHGHFLALRFVGTETERDAIGTRARVKIGNRLLNRQLIAGDGFQASNQRQSVFGVGETMLIDELQVDWPSGKSQRFTRLPVDREIVIRESSPGYVVLPTAESTNTETRP